MKKPHREEPYIDGFNDALMLVRGMLDGKEWGWLEQHFNGEGVLYGKPISQNIEIIKQLLKGYNANTETT